MNKHPMQSILLALLAVPLPSWAGTPSYASSATPRPVGSFARRGSLSATSSITPRSASRPASPTERPPVLPEASLPNLKTPLNLHYARMGEDAATGLFSARLRTRAADLPPLLSIMDSASVNGAGEAEAGADSARVRDPGGVADVEHLLSVLHAQQYPTRASCSSVRLLMVQYQQGSLEGVGSLLKLVALGLAGKSSGGLHRGPMLRWPHHTYAALLPPLSPEAAYSNRTLIWGVDLSPSLELTRASWAWDAASGAEASPVVHGLPLRCASTRGGGALGCFLQPLSSCSVADLSWEELTAVSCRVGCSREGKPHSPCPTSGAAGRPQRARRHGASQVAGGVGGYNRHFCCTRSQSLLPTPSAGFSPQEPCGLPPSSGRAACRGTLSTPRVGRCAGGLRLQTPAPRAGSL